MMSLSPDIFEGTSFDTLYPMQYQHLKHGKRYYQVLY